MSYPYNTTPGYVPQTWMPQRPDMGQGYPQAGQLPSAATQSQQGGFACRPVTSRLEAEAVQVDFIGPGTLMPDLSHGMIYLKRFNPNTGASDFMEFAFRQPQPEPEPPKYATMADLNALWAEVRQLKGTAQQEVSADET